MGKCIYHTFLLVSLLGLPLAFAAPDVEETLRQEGLRAKQNANLYYDEVFDREGNLRDQYKKIYPRLLGRNKTQLEKIRRLTKKDFSQDNALSPVALISNRDRERALKRAGVEQRGRALLEFLQDYYSGQKTYAKVIPEEVVARIVARAGEEGYRGKIKPELIKFLYGPDIIRDKDGIFRVLEDNTNYLGGQGDLLMAREALFKRVPEYKEVFGKEALSQPADFYRELLKRYRAEMVNPRAPIIFFSIPPFPDQEDKRLGKIWRDLGVEVVTPYTRNPKLVKREDGFYLERRKGSVIRREKVGFMIFNGEFSGIDPGFAPAQEPFLKAEAKAWLVGKGKNKLPNYQRIPLEKALAPDPKTGVVDYKEVERVLTKILKIQIHSGTVPGIVEAVVKGQLLTNNTPGTEFINDKEFNIYVEDLIRHYLHEEPILRNLRAERLYVEVAGERRVDPKVFAKLANHIDEYVVKVVDGRGGDGVWVGPKLSPAERLNLLQRLKADAAREVIVQEYRHPSVLPSALPEVFPPDIVDERILSYVHARGGYVSETGWSRGVSMAGDGKVNLSAGKAHEVANFEREIPCSERFGQFAKKN